MQHELLDNHNRLKWRRRICRSSHSCLYYVIVPFDFHSTWYIWRSLNISPTFKGWAQPWKHDCSSTIHQSQNQHHSQRITPLFAIHWCRHTVGEVAIAVNMVLWNLFVFESVLMFSLGGSIETQSSKLEFTASDDHESYSCHNSSTVASF